MSSLNLAVAVLGAWSALALVFKVLGVEYANARGAMFSAAAVLGWLAIPTAVGYLMYELVGSVS